MNSQPLARNVVLYPWYASVLNAHFWMPVFFLYFLHHMGLAEALRLEAIYYLGVVLMEIPSGYFSDRFGRKPTLLIANVALVAAYIVFFFGGSFGGFAVAQVLLAAGLAFNSGTDTSLHYDSLAGLGREKEFDRREAVVAKCALLASGLAALIGGSIGVFDLRYVYLLSVGAAVITLAFAIVMREPKPHEKSFLPDGPGHQIKTCARLLRHPMLAWLFAFSVLMTVLNHIPYEFYQPYIALALEGWRRLGDSASLSTGIHVGLAMVIAAWFAGRSIRIRDRIGLGGVLLSAAALQTLIIGAMSLTLAPLIVALMLLRTVPRALITAPLNAAIAPRVGQAQRATYLSIQSLAGRLGVSGFLLLLSLVPIDSEEGLWPAISTKLGISTGLGVLGLVVLCTAWKRMTRSLDTTRQTPRHHG